MNTNTLRMPVVKSFATACDAAEALINALNLGDTICMNGITVTKIAAHQVWATGFEHAYHTTSHVYTGCELAEFCFYPDRAVLNDWVRTWANGSHDVQFFLDRQNNTTPTEALEWMDQDAFYTAYDEARRAGETKDTEYTSFKIAWYKANVPADRNPYRDCLDLSDFVQVNKRQHEAAAVLADFITDGEDLADLSAPAAAPEIEPFISPEDEAFLEGLCRAGQPTEAQAQELHGDDDRAGISLSAMYPDEDLGTTEPDGWQDDTDLLMRLAGA